MTKKAIDTAARTITFDLEDGSEPIVFDATKAPQAIREHAELHGFSQKIGDSYAGAAAAVEEGLYETPEAFIRDQIQRASEQLLSGDWNTRSGGAGGARVTDLAVALAEALGQPLEDCVQRLDEASKEEKASVRKHPQVAAILSRIRAERAAAKAEKDAKQAEKGEAVDLAGMFA